MLEFDQVAHLENVILNLETQINATIDDKMAVVQEVEESVHNSINDLDHRLSEAQDSLRSYQRATEDIKRIFEVSSDANAFALCCAHAYLIIVQFRWPATLPCVSSGWADLA